MDRDDILLEAEMSMDKSVDYLVHEFSGVRTGKASPGLVENVDVAAYGSTMKLKQLAGSNQVLCVTHQPQIARFADSHLLVQKDVVSGHTEVKIEKLDRRARVEEIARMLTGAEITDSARRHARELLKT